MTADSPEGEMIGVGSVVLPGGRWGSCPTLPHGELRLSGYGPLLTEPSPAQTDGGSKKDAMQDAHRGVDFDPRAPS